MTANGLNAYDRRTAKYIQTAYGLLCFRFVCYSAVMPSAMGASSLTFSLVVVSSRPQGEKLTRKVGRPTKQGAQ